MESELHNAHDKGYKYILSIKRLFVQLLKSFVDQGWVDKIEPEDVELVDKSFILPDFKNKEADLVYKVKMDGTNVYFYLLELQSSVDYQMPTDYYSTWLRFGATCLKKLIKGKHAEKISGFQSLYLVFCTMAVEVGQQKGVSKKPFLSLNSLMNLF